jgi:hypothetical protein
MRLAAAFIAVGSIGGCAGSAPPRTADTLLSSSPHTDSITTTDSHVLVSGGADSVGAIPGSPGAQYVYVFRQTDPSSDRFAFQDRDLSFWFRPSPTVLHFQVENRTDTPVWIEWDRCTFVDSFGASKRIANSETRWSQRYSSVGPTQIPGLQRHGDYVFPIDYLVDPAASPDQLHRPLFPEDRSAPQYTDREFGVTLVFRIHDRLQPYPFHFKIRSVLPR